MIAIIRCTSINILENLVNAGKVLQERVLSAELSDLQSVAESLQAKLFDVEANENGPASKMVKEEEQHQVEVTQLRASIESMKEALEIALAPPPLPGIGPIAN